MASAPIPAAPKPFNLFLHVRDDGKTRVNLHVYPPQVVASRYKDISKFIFPDAGGAATNLDLLTYTFVLTDDSGNRQYCHTTRTVTNEAFCIVSHYPWCNFFNWIVHIYRTNGTESGQIMLKSLFSSTVPLPGESFPVTVAGVRPLRPQDSLCKLIDSSPAAVLSLFSVDLLLRLLSAIMLERHIAVIGPNFHTVATCILSVLSMVAPFEWHHTLIPVLPKQLAEVLASPTPYIVGLLSTQLPLLEKVSIESLVVVRLACDGSCESVTYLEYEEVPLPKSSGASKLRMQLAMLQKTPTTTSRDISEVFVHYFAENFGRLFGSPEVLAADAAIIATAAAAAAAAAPAAAAPTTVAAMKVAAAASGQGFNDQDRRFFTAFCATAGMHTQQEAFNASLRDGSWQAAPFVVKCVKLHRKRFASFWASIASASVDEASPSGGSSKASKSHGLGRLLCRRLGAWCGSAEALSDDKMPIYSV